MLPTPAGVAIEPRVANLGLGDTFQLAATVTDGSGRPLSGVSITWTSSDSTVLSVSTTGLLRAKEIGQARITAAAGDGHDALDIDVAIHYAKVGAEGGVVCAITTAAVAYCRGVNYFGELGNGTTDSSATFVPVTGGLRFAKVLPGIETTCGLTTDSLGYCWGLGAFGSLGTPTAVPSPLTFTLVGAGEYHDCGVTADSAAFCWLFHCGAAFDVVCNEAPSPVAVPGNTKFTQVASGYDNDTCGLAADGTVSCWWVYRDSSTTPIVMPGTIRFRTISVAEGALTPSIPSGDYGCGIASDSTAYCWGFQRANLPGGAAVYDPVPLPGGLRYISLDTFRGSGGKGHVCGIVPGGSAYCWSSDDPAPVPVPGGRTFVSVAASFQSNCALAADGIASCWGYNSYGQLGIGFSSSQSLVPLPVTGGHEFTAIAMEFYHTCGLAPDSTAYCWGSNEAGMLGTGDTVSSVAPVPVAGGLRFASLVAGDHFTCGLVSDGSAYCWGLGMLNPVAQQAETRFTSLSHSIYGNVCGTTTAGDVECWAIGGARAPPRTARRVPRPLAP